MVCLIHGPFSAQRRKENMKEKFCGECGARLDEATGLCPKCDAEKLRRWNEWLDQPKWKEQPEAPKQRESAPAGGREEKKRKSGKKETTAQKKARKREQRAQWSTGKKVRNSLVKTILIILLLLVAAIGTIGVLNHFGIIQNLAVKNAIKKAYDMFNDGAARNKPNKDAVLVNFAADETCFWKNDKNNVIFTVQVINEQPKSVDLCSDQNVICQMFDDGKDGDAVAGDGTYSCVLSVLSEEDVINYHAQMDKHQSDFVDLYFFEKPTEESVYEMKNYQNEIQKIENRFCNKDGYVEESNLDRLMEEVETYAELLRKNGGVMYYEVSASSILFKFKTGLTYVYMPSRFGIDASGADTTISVLTLQPCLHTYTSDLEQYLQLPDRAAESISNKLQSRQFNDTNNYDNQEVTLELIKSFSENQIIIWHGHGGYSTSLHSYLQTGEEFDWNAWWWNPVYCLDSLQNRFVECKNGYVAFTSKYIDKYCKNLNGSFFYLAACASGKDDVLAQSFIKKGGSAVVANSETINTEYNLRIQNATLLNMLQYNPSSGELYTLDEALKIAKREVGENDSQYGDKKKEIATPIIFGGERAENYSFNAFDKSSNVNSNDRNVPVDAVEFDGHYYYLFDTDSVTTWNEAKDYCESLGGYLAAITSQVENDFLYDYIYHHGYESAYFGLTDAGSEGTWSWCNGEPVSYVHWASGEPNNEGGGESYGMFYWKYPDATWNDGDFGSGTQNGGKAFICEWGEYTTAQEPERTTSGERDIVLVLDVSGSMAGSPMEETKKASVKFIDTILDEDASIGIVTYDDSASMQADFSADKAALEATVSGIYDGGSTNIEAGLAEADSMLRTSGARKKIIVLMSDGEPNAGKEGDELIAYADSLKEKGIIIYTLGFFESLGGYKSYAQTLMEGIASDGCHYEVASADDLVFFFEDMADQINGQKYIYIRIACPVDVTVAYNGEILSSEEDRLNVRTEFGTLTFEEREDGSSADAEDRIKVLRLKEGAEYDVRINGTGRGLMDYTIGFMDENGEYSDFRRFEKVKITRKTKIDTVAAVSETSVLNIDEDGDGRYDLKLRAEENGYGEEVDNSLLIYAAIGGGALLLVVVLVLVVRGNRKKRKTER